MQRVEVMEAWTKALENQDGDVVEKVDEEHIGVEVEEFRREPKRTQPTEDPTLEFVSSAGCEFPLLRK